MSEHTINGFMGVSMEQIHSLVDANTMMGDPIPCGNGTTIIPVSKISVGFASGGSDLPTRTSKEFFAGGAGGGMSVNPIGFLVVKNGDVQLMQLTMNADKGNVFLDMLPGLIDKLSAAFSKDKGKKTLTPDEAAAAKLAEGAEPVQSELVE
ncbi:MAG: sporulation protein YtfJ [Oscillospiraceae bacterium]|nr:sporulation protein YtfJ [Oscillospiraceae bacterium]